MNIVIVYLLLAVVFVNAFLPRAFRLGAWENAVADFLFFACFIAWLIGMAVVRSSIESDFAALVGLLWYTALIFVAVFLGIRSGDYFKRRQVMDRLYRWATN